MSLNENEQRLAPEFERAMRLRDEGKLDEAVLVLNELVEQLAPDDRRMRAHSFMQLGYIYGRLGRDVAREGAFRAAVEIAPRMELASMGLFHALLALDRTTAAYEEMVRFLQIRDSDMYRELLCEGYEQDGRAEHVALVNAARELLAKHRRN